LGLMTATLFVGNLAFEVSENDLREAFAPFGNVESVKIARDRGGRPRGFAHVELPDEEAAEAAIDGLRGTQLRGRTLDVAEADQRGGGRGGRSRGGFRRGGGRRRRR